MSKRKSLKVNDKWYHYFVLPPDTDENNNDCGCRVEITGNNKDDSLCPPVYFDCDKVNDDLIRKIIIEKNL